MGVDSWRVRGVSHCLTGPSFNKTQIRVVPQFLSPTRLVTDRHKFQWSFERNKSVSSVVNPASFPSNSAEDVVVKCYWEGYRPVYAEQRTLRLFKTANPLRIPSFISSLGQTLVVILVVYFRHTQMSEPGCQVAGRSIRETSAPQERVLALFLFKIYLFIVEMYLWKYKKKRWHDWTKTIWSRTLTMVLGHEWCLCKLHIPNKNRCVLKLAFSFV